MKRKLRNERGKRKKKKKKKKKKRLKYHSKKIFRSERIQWQDIQKRVEKKSRKPSGKEKPKKERYTQRRHMAAFISPKFSSRYIKKIYGKVMPNNIALFFFFLFSHFLSISTTI